MPEKINFTKTALLALEPLPGKRRRVYDEKQKGLVVYVSPTGSKVFYCLKKVDGKVEEIRIGEVATVTIETARAQAAKIINDIAAGANPAEQRRRKRAEMTFAQLFAEWTREARARGKRSVANDERNYRLHLQGLAKRKLSEIQRQHVRVLHQKIGKDSGIYAANRLLALVRAVFNFGIKELDLSLSNPAAGIRMHREESRDRRLHADELPRFFEALAEEENVDIRDYVLISLLTGGRRSNVLSMRWDEISLERGTWRIPSSKAKAGEAIEVPLSTAAQEILRSRASANGTQGFVFPGPGRAGHLVEPRKGWERILRRAGIEDLRLHDLRRSLASFQIDAGVSLAVIGKGLGHQSQATTAVYARLAQEPVRDAMEKGAAAILAAAGVTNPAKVVPIKKGKCSA
ncbi:site-specific integrase [Acidithiobacillus caldus]|uniref:tyrosine-type recombinase/integrase n=1 Tax=Acidithiobacillus caldus TaxID=33059 RepID=UPI001C07D459|nr:site-specific integrase [Acidithiobacillus caldus]MBU2820337.1 site-specific integrase [Acidithiobacillus caldus]